MQQQTLMDLKGEGKGGTIWNTILHTVDVDLPESTHMKEQTSHLICPIRSSFYFWLGVYPMTMRRHVRVDLDL